jgi:hypothetical protein
MYVYRECVLYYMITLKLSPRSLLIFVPIFKFYSVNTVFYNVK